MTAEQFKKWKANGNLKLANQEIYESLVNDLSEGVTLLYGNLRELAKYLHLSLIESGNENQMLKLDVLHYALNFQTK